MDHLSAYLKGHKFLQFTDKKPLEKLNTVQNITFTRIQEYMALKKGDEMPANYLNRHPMDDISFNGAGPEKVDYRDTLKVEQLRCELCQVLKYYLEHFEISPKAPARISKLVKLGGGRPKGFYNRCSKKVKKNK
jgi:hypothetical protein